MYIKITQGNTTLTIDNIGIKKNWFVSDYKDVINTVMSGFKRYLSDNSEDSILVDVKTDSNSNDSNEDPLLNKIKNIVKSKVSENPPRFINDEEEELLPFTAGATDTPEFTVVTPEQLEELREEWHSK